MLDSARFKVYFPLAMKKTIQLTATVYGPTLALGIRAFDQSEIERKANQLYNFGGSTTANPIFMHDGNPTAENPIPAFAYVLTTEEKLEQAFSQIILHRWRKRLRSRLTTNAFIRKYGAQALTLAQQRVRDIAGEGFMYQTDRKERSFATVDDQCAFPQAVRRFEHSNN